MCAINFLGKVKANSVLKITHIRHGHCCSVHYGIQHFTYQEPQQYRTPPHQHQKMSMSQQHTT
jgi:hypothetical protein